MAIQTLNLLSHFPVVGPLGGFQFFSIINMTAVTVFLHMAFAVFLIIASG